ncbi:uncharacterized protein LOC122264551 [Penaeus japonicus]|uniref:uncharacterized protein LOC122264551 n=1 Tax=Penaeus japonicus TaxID=27405 RepID=UPI001C71779F|nr:uncharacterized protein LOC122264551 [Penaeus japonicus]
MSKFDELLIHLGAGRWNMLVFLAAGYWMIQVPCHSVGGAFLTPEVDHTCRPSPDSTNASGVSQCKYNVTTSAENYEERPCRHWDFDNTTYTNTLTSEFQLVCEHRFLRPAFKSLYFFGAFIWSPINGWLSDRYGRKTMLVLGTCTYSILANILCWLPNVSAILLARFCMGIMHPTSIHSAFSLEDSGAKILLGFAIRLSMSRPAMEVCVPRHRSFVGILIFLPWTLSIIALGGYGYLLRDWRWFVFTVSLPSLLFLPALWFIDESPRWLIVKGRHKEALGVLRKAARWNRVKLPPEDTLLTMMADIQKEVMGSFLNLGRWSNFPYLRYIQEGAQNHGRATSVVLVDHLRNVGNELIILFRTRRMRIITLYLYVNYTVAGLVYYGLSLGGDKFGVDPFVYMALSGVMELPGSTLTIPMVDRMGRRTSNVLCFFVTAGVLLALGVIPSGIDWLVTTMALLGKLAISGAYQILSLHATELFPTEVRVRGLGTCSMMSKIGSISAPFLVEVLGAIGSWAPLVLFGAGGFVAGVVTLRLPETREALLQDTVAGLEAAGKAAKEKWVRAFSPARTTPGGERDTHLALCLSAPVSGCRGSLSPALLWLWRRRRSLPECDDANRTEMSTFDDLLQQLGTGKWNLTIVLSVCYWVMLLPSHSVGPAFLTPEMGHTCRFPEYAVDEGNTTDKTRSQCSYNIRTADGITEEGLCTEWDFDNTTYTNTITSEFNLVCSLSFLRPTFKSIYFFGALIGGPFSGWFSDRYGRKLMFSVGTVSFTVLANLLCWLPDMYSILAVRFLLGFMSPTSIHAGYTLSMETCEPRVRAATGILIFLPWTVALIFLGGFGYLLRDWRWLMFVLSLPMLLFLPVLWFLDESPRWLIVRGRHQQALRVLQKAGRWNRVALPAEEELYVIMEHIQKEAQKTRRLSDAITAGPMSCLRGLTSEATVLIRTRRIRTLTLALYLDYLVLGTVYYGLTLGGDQFGVDPFVYMALGGVMELPSSTLTIPMVEKMGRKPSSVLCFLVTAGALLALGFTSLGWLGMVFTMVGKMAITAAYQIVYLYASELFPTEVRQRGMGTATMVAKVGSVSAPFLVETLSSIGPWVPLVIFGGASLVAAGVTLKLPETRGTCLQDTVAGLEASGSHSQQT